MSMEVLVNGKIELTHTLPMLLLWQVVPICIIFLEGLSVLKDELRDMKSTVMLPARMEGLFLVVCSSRFGRPIKINSRFLS